MEDNQEEELYYCDFCSEECTEDEIINFGDHSMCQNCYDEKMVTCDHCGSTIWQDNAVSDEHTCLCQECYEDHYQTCCECGRIIHYDDSFYEESDDDQDSPYCEMCFNKGNHVIHSYSYKPSPVFYGKGLFMGVELEIDGGGESNQNAERIIEIANSDAEHVYIKHDGSLHDGFEIVTHPMNLEYHMKSMPWKKILTEAVGMA